MLKIYQKIPFYLEYLINGLFIITYGLITTKLLDDSFRYFDILQTMQVVFTSTAPIIVGGAMLGNYWRSDDLEDFFRRYIFSFIIFVPMLITWGDTRFAFWLSLVHIFSTILSFYDKKLKWEPIEVKHHLSDRIMAKFQLAPAQIVLVSFFVVIAVGTVLLLLPFSAETGQDISFIDALFMATSATCVTGLATISLPDNFSFVGEIIILALVQIGGLGFMTLSSSLAIMMGKSMRLQSQMMMQNILDMNSSENLLSMIIDIIKYTIVIEICGGILLSIGFTMEGLEFGQAVYFGFYHSITAFCNAGFALFNNSFESYAHNPIINITICLLITLGGIGFVVIKELESWFKREVSFSNFSLHSKVVLVTSLFLTVFGALYIFFSEYLYALDSRSFLDKVQISLFQSITLRTAGFNTIALNTLQPHTLYFMSLLMFIGASPGSTGGGIKTTTFALVVQSVKATLKGKVSVELFKRTIPNQLIVRSTALVAVSIVIVSSFILLMMQLEPEQTLLPIMFEVFSAFGTVGLSVNLTPYLSEIGKLAIASLMYIGRVGPLTLALAVSRKSEDDRGMKYPEATIMIG